jgi:hypothetical protein
MFNFIDTLHIFIPVSGCVGRGPSALLCPGAYNAVKTALVWRLEKTMFVFSDVHSKDIRFVLF